MEFKKSEKSLPTPSANCTPVSLIKTKRLRPVEKITDAQVTIQFFTPNVQKEKENEFTPSSQKSNLSPGIFTRKSFHNTGFTPRNIQNSLSEKREDALNR